ncbi:ParB N-terminal domain-containing protein [Streptococcus sp. HMSC056C01]|uniref:ParB N-terminal domain-containing protein n=1 Tax=Streptococcus sp. HMSC056C01 TaxID=1739299 RepID=UPI0008C7FEEA|nr:ParB N-terminal domain-containing protein [Streptococcus sp. HMSC056C01]OFK86067.1 chromosome partitioning protein ParB [Streptococcus sp. HMSC056C01]
MNHDLNELIKNGNIEKTTLTKRLTIGSETNDYPVYKFPLEYLYYNDQNGRINTVYHQYISNHGKLTPEIGESKYNEIFEKFIFESKKQALKDTQVSISEKGQQEPGVILSDGRVIDGNRRFTALRRIQKETKIQQYFEAVILSFDISNKIDEKKIKELELDLQLGREERVSYDPIDRIFDVYNTIEVQKLMTPEEYKKASGAGNTKGINKDLRLAKLIIKFLSIVAPNENPIDKFYLARELKLDGPLEDIERTINKLKKDKETITQNVLTILAVQIAKSEVGDRDITRKIRDVKYNILDNPEMKEHFISATDEHVDNIIDFFESNPIDQASDLKNNLNNNLEIAEISSKLLQTTNRLSNKGQITANRRQSLVKLQEIRDTLEDLSSEDLKELYEKEFFEAKEILQEIRDLAFKLSK